MHHCIVCPYFSCKFKYNLEQIFPHGYVRLSNRVLTRHLQILSSFYIFQTVKFSFGLEILYEPHGLKFIV